MNIFKKKNTTEPTDEVLLRQFLTILQGGRVQISPEFIQNDVGFVVASVLNIQCGDFQMHSPPIMLDWPMEPVAFPEEHKELLN